MVTKYSSILIILFSLSINTKIIYSNNRFSIGILKYRGGDWYSCKNAVKHFLYHLKKRTSINVNKNPVVVDASSREIFNYPFIVLNGHGQILLNPLEKDLLKKYLLGGGFLFVNDDYGIDKHFRKLMKELFPTNKLISLPKSHTLLKSYYNFNFIPKIHKHNNKKAQALAIIIQRRIVVLYMYESDIMDGWEKKDVHNVPEIKRENAIKFGINIVYYSLTR